MTGISFAKIFSASTSLEVRLAIVFSALLPILTVLALELILAVLSMKSEWMSRLLCGKPAILIREGRIVACDSVEALTKTNAKRVTVHGSVDLSRLDGIRGLQETEGAVSFLYSGEPDRLLRCLAAGHVADLSVSEPDLEEIFLHFYEQEG